MKLPRRTFLRLAAGAVALPAIARAAFAVDYPVRPVHIVVGYPPGAAPDIVARLMSQWLAERLGQQFVVDNPPGAASHIRTQILAQATPGGFPVLVAGSTNALH